MTPALWIGAVAVGSALEFRREVGLHAGSESGVEPAGVEHAIGVEGLLEFLVDAGKVGRSVACRGSARRPEQPRLQRGQQVGRRHFGKAVVQSCQPMFPFGDAAGKGGIGADARLVQLLQQRIADGLDPDGDCPDDGAASCQRDGRRSARARR